MAPGSITGEDFDPQHPTVDASINRLTIAGTLGVPERLAGRPAYDILSAEAIAALSADYQEVFDTH